MTEAEATEKEMYMQFLEEDCKIDINKKLEYPPVAISLGERVIRKRDGDMLVPVPIGTFGNISVISAPPKTKKTFFVSLLGSVFMSGSNKCGGDLKGHRGNGNLIHFDTEQGEWHCQNIFKRIVEMDSSIDKSKYHTYSLRTLNNNDKLDFIEHYLKTKIKEPSLVIIDGITDLVKSINNEEDCVEVVQKLMRISTKYKCHILTVIHSNFGSDKMTGHLGSYLAKKVETQIELEKNPVNKDWITVRCKNSRGFEFPTFSFEVNNYGMPTVVRDLYDPLK
mgnify:FL=1